MSVSENFKKIECRKNAAAKKSDRNPEDVLLLAVTKKHTVEEINEAIDAGATDIGENRVQEMLSKYADVKPVRWHLIGHLQTNKVKQIIDKVVMIHSVDSYHLAEEIEKRAKAANLIMDVLIEVNVAKEKSKSGIPEEELLPLTRKIVDSCSHVRIRGIMCIPPRNEDAENSRPYFKKAARLMEMLKNEPFPVSRVQFDTLSMGMSEDFEVAIEEGSTIVRVGTSIFGKREYR